MSAYLSYLIILVAMPIITMLSVPTATSHQLYTYTAMLHEMIYQL